MKRKFSILLVLVSILAFTFVGCNNGKYAIVGTWKRDGTDGVHFEFKRNGECVSFRSDYEKVASWEYEKETGKYFVTGGGLDTCFIITSKTTLAQVEKDYVEGEDFKIVSTLTKK